LEITNACNMTCTHCYVSSGKKMDDELSLDEIFKAIDMLPPFSGKRVALSGGEPAVHKDCGRIVEHCAVQCGHDVDLYTNGKKFPRKLAEQIGDINARGGAIVRVQVSLEAATPSLNDLVRGKGSFAAASESLAMFKELGLSRHVVIFVCMTNRIVSQVDDIIRLAEQYDVGMLVFSQWQKQGNAKDTPWASLAPSTADWVAIGEKLLRYRNPRLRVYGNFFGELSNNEIGRLCLDARLFPKQVYFYNAVPRVTPEGDIFADQLWVDPAWILGNTRTITLEESFNTPKFYGQLEQMRHRTEHIPECQACEWRPLCEGGSAGHTYAEYGHMNAKDLFCESRKYWFNRYVEHQLKQAFPADAT
jgi:radical SAM protein with 4Fe4S-binding SPASM domain